MDATSSALLQTLDQLNLAGMVDGMTGDAEHQREPFVEVQGRCARPARDVIEYRVQPLLLRFERRLDRCPREPLFIAHVEPLFSFYRKRLGRHAADLLPNGSSEVRMV